MTRQLRLPLAVALCSSLLYACSGNDTSTTTDTTSTDTTTVTTPVIVEEAVTYTDDTTTLNGYVVYNKNATAKSPVVLVVHEWWGLNDYPRSRARQLADMGYVAMAVDMFGNGRIAANPDEALKMAMPFYENPALTKSRLTAALHKLSTYQQADLSKAAAIGYCYGGFSVLNAAKLGTNLKGVVSFHGNLSGAPVSKDSLKAAILVCHGGADGFVPEAEINAFKKSMDSVGADYTFKVYPNATHAFTNPAATETGKKFNMPIQYNGAADTASWNDMKAFFGKIFQ